MADYAGPTSKTRHIRLNSHPRQGGVQAPPVHWGARDPAERGPVIGTVADPALRNAIGVHSGSYGIYRALAIAAQELRADHRPDFTDTSPAEPIGPFESWFDPKKIVSLDPWGHMVAEVFSDKLAAGWDIRPTIAVAKAHVAMPETRIACRLHDECNGSDVFSSDICTCRPYLAHGMEICIEMAQQGGVGVVIYNRKEGRALGEVTKFLVYNARKRQIGGDSAAQYFNRTECVAGVQDMRFQELMPDLFHWLGIGRIDRFASMSNLKSDALREQGIEIVEQVAIPDELIPADAQVEMDAKKAAGYFTIKKPEVIDLVKPKGRGLNE